MQEIWSVASCRASDRMKYLLSLGAARLTNKTEALCNEALVRQNAAVW
jgi:hypothetical protein